MIDNIKRETTIHSVENSTTNAAIFLGLYNSSAAELLIASAESQMQLLHYHDAKALR